MSFIEQWLHDAVPALVGGQWRKGQQTFAVDSTNFLRSTVQNDTN